MFCARHNWDAAQLAEHYHLYPRSVQRWMDGDTCPGIRKLKLLCRQFSWNFAQLFGKANLMEQADCSRHLTLTELQSRFLRLQPKEPLEAWSYVPLAGALLFNAFSHAGFDCQAKINHEFQTCIEFLEPQLQHARIKVSVVFNRGITMQRVDVAAMDINSEPVLEYSNINFDTLVKGLRNGSH